MEQQSLRLPKLWRRADVSFDFGKKCCPGRAVTICFYCWCEFGLCVACLQAAEVLNSGLSLLSACFCEARELERSLITRVRARGPVGHTNQKDGGDGLSDRGSPEVYVYVTFHSQSPM